MLATSNASVWQSVPGAAGFLGRQSQCSTEVATTGRSGHDLTSPCANGKESGLPLPSTFLPARLPAFQSQLKAFLVSGKYRNLSWCEDKGLRDTGPYVNHVGYGVHPTVKIYYSPAIVSWLLRKNPDVVIPDGAVIVKEQYTAPAARYQVQGPAQVRGWTTMIKDSKGSRMVGIGRRVGPRNAPI